jgi:hypothetical protein
LVRGRVKPVQRFYKSWTNDLVHTHDLSIEQHLAQTDSMQYGPTRTCEASYDSAIETGVKCGSIGTWLKNCPAGLKPKDGWIRLTETVNGRTGSMTFSARRRISCLALFTICLFGLIGESQASVPRTTSSAKKSTFPVRYVEAFFDDNLFGIEVFQNEDCQGKSHLKAARGGAAGCVDPFYVQVTVFDTTSRKPKQLPIDVSKWNDELEQMFTPDFGGRILYDLHLVDLKLEKRAGRTRFFRSDRSCPLQGFSTKSPSGMYAQSCSGGIERIEISSTIL